MKQRLLNRLKPYRFVAGVAILLTFSLFLLSHSLQTAQDFTNTYGTLLITNVVGAGILLIWLAFNLWQLWRDIRQQVPGSRLQWRLVGALALLIGIPMLVAFYFARHVIHQSVENWFDTQTEQVLQDALTLSRSLLDLKTRDSLNRLNNLIERGQHNLLNNPTNSLTLIADTLGDRNADITLFSSSGQVIATASIDTLNTSTLLPQPLPDNILQQVRQGTSYASLDAETLSDQTLTSFIRIVLPVRDNNNRVQALLQTQFHLPDELRQQTDRVAKANSQYQTLAFLREPLKVSVTINLALVVLLTLLGAVLAGIQAARSFTRPVSELTKGAQSIASGDYNLRLEHDRNDEIGDLMISFNDMATQIQKSRDELRRSQLTAEGQKRYLQILLDQITAGVVTSDHKARLRTTNNAAMRLLNANIDQDVSQPLALLSTHYPHTKPFVEAIEQAITELQLADHKNPDHIWESQITLTENEQRRTLMLRVSRLPDLLHTAGGLLVVFDDITAIVQAQRYAAWQDIARRLAHEIKNPLTPIQLAADRLRHRLLNHLEEEDARILDRATHTIIQQVDSMKRLVQDFADFAKSPKIHMHTVDVNGLIQDMVIMYPMTEKQHLNIITQLDPQCPSIMADSGRLRQMFHNLIKNALEATEEVDKPQLIISTQCHDRQLKLTFADNGPGIPESLRQWIFEPYATNKPKGTGLGMAIVKRILDEHNATISISNHEPHGAKICLLFPFETVHHA
jgi:nitrogen fixation/metabolism regulation signal transduction histidine kinase